jgi:uncharacterized protein YdhG (YjbR/CyaY superfamily)
MDEAVRSYIAAIEPAHRALFDRVHGLILTAHPEAVVSISYQIGRTMRRPSVTTSWPA